MDPDVVASLVGDVVSALGLFLPLIPGGAAVAPVLAILTKALPLISQAVKAEPQIYMGIKNLITALRADASTLPAQRAALRTLDAAVDAAFDAADDDADLAGQI